ncbi:MAG: tyrosinase family protein, partial [Holophagales bacterium]|nr:tyrosinase family protein [Holophagales bacterium]
EPDRTEPDCLVPEPGRGARSGLVQGLKGQFPFDGSQFPPLPWGGTRVAPDDILFISRWIDDGCPPNDEIPICQDPVPYRPEWQTVCGGGKSVNDHHDDHGKPKVRKNYESLTKEELCRLRFAVGALRALDRFPADNRSFAYWGKVHGDHCQHGWEQFLPWHRAYLYRFELALQKVVPGVTLPYWDWTMPIYFDGAVPPRGDLPYEPQSGRVPTGMRCYVDARALQALKDGVDHPVPENVIRALGTIENDRDGSDRNRLYNSSWELFFAAGLGPEEYVVAGSAVAAELARTNPLWYDFRYPGMYYQSNESGAPRWKNGQPQLARQALESTFHHHYPTADEVEQVLALDNWHDFGGGHFENQSFGVLSQNPHNTGHIWSGGSNPFWQYPGTTAAAQPRFGDMFNDLTAFYDPIGYAHHSNIDRLWWQWQRSNPGQDPDDPTAEMVPFHMNIAETLNIHSLGYEYVRDARMHPTDRGQEITHLDTEPISFDDHVLDGAKRVEIRFHNVLRAVESYNVRVFVNQPGADVSTPTRGNPRYVGYFGRFGHGPCVGGPGHCDPPAHHLPFEIPVRDHNTPHHYRLDATEAVSTLAAQGETRFRINTVAVSGDGTAREGLKMDGVSIHVVD